MPIAYIYRYIYRYILMLAYIFPPMGVNQRKTTTRSFVIHHLTRSRTPPARHRLEIQLRKSMCKRVGSKQASLNCVSKSIALCWWCAEDAIGHVTGTPPCWTCLNGAKYHCWSEYCVIYSFVQLENYLKNT